MCEGGVRREREGERQQENERLASFRCFLSIYSVRVYSGEESATEQANRRRKRGQNPLMREHIEEKNT